MARFDSVGWATGGSAYAILIMGEESWRLLGCGHWVRPEFTAKWADCPFCPVKPKRTVWSQ